MSEIKNIFDISGRAMASQLIRLNTVASNLANAGTISGSKEEAYRSRVIQKEFLCQTTHLLTQMDMSIAQQLMKMKR